MVLEMPPTWASASMTMGAISVRLNSSSAAVRPAGPAPAMTAISFGLSVEDMICGNQVVRRSHFSAVIEVPILPSSTVFVTQRIESYIFWRNDKPKLQIRADCDQILGSKRTRSGLFLSPAAGLSQIGQYLPVRIHERKQNFRTAPNLERGRA